MIVTLTFLKVTFMGHPVYFNQFVKEIFIRCSIPWIVSCVCRVKSVNLLTAAGILAHYYVLRPLEKGENIELSENVNVLRSKDLFLLVFTCKVLQFEPQICSSR